MNSNKRMLDGGRYERDEDRKDHKRRRSELTFKSLNVENKQVQDLSEVKEESVSPSSSPATMDNKEEVKRSMASVVNSTSSSSTSITRRAILIPVQVDVKSFGFPRGTSPALIAQVTEKLAEYQKKMERGTISNEEKKFMRHPKLLLSHLQSLVGVKQKRQRLPPITPLQRARVREELFKNEMPKGSVDMEMVARRTGTEYHQVRYQVKVASKEIEERTGVKPERERQVRPKISRAEKTSLNQLDHTSQSRPRGSCDRHRIAKMLGVRRDQADHHYLKH